MQLKRIGVGVALLGLAFGGGALAASAQTANDATCVAESGTGTTWNSGRLHKYEACRFDKLDAAVKDLGATTPAPSPSAPSSPSATSTKTPTPTPTASPTATTAPVAGAVCKPGSEAKGYDGKPIVFTGQGSTGLGPLYNASAEQWNTNGYNFAQTMGVCSHDSWYVDVKTDNAKGDGAVKSYPSMRAIYWDYSTSDGNMPRLSTFPQLKVDYAGVNPSSCTGCIYDTAHDIWLNGIGINQGTTELMIWTKNAGQRPYGDRIKTGIVIGDHTYELWFGTGNGAQIASYVVTDTPDAASGTIDVKAFVANLSSLGKIEADPKVGQLSYGVEPVSTGNVTKHWDFTKFTVTSN